jgi:hypothetical protein
LTKKYYINLKIILGLVQVGVCTRAYNVYIDIHKGIHI